jgi:hypothetical protein
MLNACSQWGVTVSLAPAAVASQAPASSVAPASTMHSADVTPGGPDDDDSEHDERVDADGVPAVHTKKSRAPKKAKAVVKEVDDVPADVAESSTTDHDDASLSSDDESAEARKLSVAPAASTAVSERKGRGVGGGAV